MSDSCSPEPNVYTLLLVDPLQVRGYVPVDPSASPQIVDAAAQQAQLTALAQRRQELQYQLQKFEASSQAAAGAWCGTPVLLLSGLVGQRCGIAVPEQPGQQLQRAFHQPGSSRD